VIEDLSVRLESGRFYGLLGPNGCGKTTLVDLLVRLRHPSGGSVRFRGKPLAGIPRRQLARQMALVPQDFQINFPFTAREVILMGRYPHMPRFSPPSPEDLEVVETVMDQTDTTYLADQCVTTLSGGERQRVVFARALAQQSPVLLLDESTSNLDIRHALHLLELTEAKVRNDGATVLAVFQDIHLAALFCEEMFFMKDGRVVAAGPTPEVLTPRTLKAVYGVASRIRKDPETGDLHVAFRR
jgi:iron complex transport system ATP-binding protein